jgi:predicted nucleic acid-binding protein
MDYADATLVAPADRLDRTRVFSLDRKDFGNLPFPPTALRGRP